MATYTKQPLNVEARQYLDSASGLDITTWINTLPIDTGAQRKQFAEFVLNMNGEALGLIQSGNDKTATLNDYCVLNEDGEFSFLSPISFESKYAFLA